MFMLNKSIAEQRLVMHEFYKLAAKTGWKVNNKSSGTDDDDDPARIEAMADILGGLFGDDALKFFDPPKHEKAWNETDHPRGKNGKFMKRGGSEAVDSAHAKVKEILKGGKTAETHKQLIDHLSILTTKQIHEIRKKNGLKASGRLKTQLVEKLAERLGDPESGKPKIKQEKPLTVRKLVRDYGGLSAAATRGTYDIKTEFTENGLLGLFNKKARHGLDTMAQELQNDGKLTPPQGVDAERHLLHLLQQNAVSEIADISGTIEAEYAKYHQEMEDARNHAEIEGRDIEQHQEQGKEDSRLGAEKGDAFEGESDSGRDRGEDGSEGTAGGEVGGFDPGEWEDKPARAKVEDDEPEPQSQPVNYANAITIAADSIGELRKQDVYRVLDSMQTSDNVSGMAAWIESNRPDLKKEIAEASADISDERGYAKQSAPVASPAKKEPWEMTAHEAMKAGVDFGTWYGGVTDAWRNEKTKEDDPIYHSVSGIKPEDYRRAQKIFGQKIHTRQGENGAVTDISPDLSQITVTHDDGKTSIHSTDSVSTITELIDWAVADAKDGSLHESRANRIAPHIAKEIVDKKGNLFAKLKEMGVDPMSRGGRILRDAVASAIERETKERSKPSPARQAAMDRQRELQAGDGQKEDPEPFRQEFIDSINQAKETDRKFKGEGRYEAETWQRMKAKHPNKPLPKLSKAGAEYAADLYESDGKPVPPEVLADYPDLAAKYGVKRPKSFRLSKSFAEFRIAQHLGIISKGGITKIITDKLGRKRKYVDGKQVPMNATEPATAKQSAPKQQAEKKPKPPTPKQQAAAAKKELGGATKEMTAAQKAHAAAQKKHDSHAKKHATAHGKHEAAKVKLAAAQEAHGKAKTEKQKAAASKRLQTATNAHAKTKLERDAAARLLKAHKAALAMAQHHAETAAKAHADVVAKHGQKEAPKVEEKPAETPKPQEKPPEQKPAAAKPKPPGMVARLAKEKEGQAEQKPVESPFKNNSESIIKFRRHGGDAQRVAVDVSGTKHNLTLISHINQAFPEQSTFSVEAHEAGKPVVMGRDDAEFKTESEAKTWLDQKHKELIDQGGKPVEATEDKAPKAEPVNRGPINADHVKNGIKDLSRTRQYEDGLVPVHKLYSQVQAHGADVTPEQFKKFLMKLWDKDEVEMKVLNEVRMLTPDQKKVSPQQGDNVYGFVMLKEPKKK